jgi:hypothetical protein
MIQTVQEQVTSLIIRAPKIILSNNVELVLGLRGKTSICLGLTKPEGVN